MEETKMSRSKGQPSALCPLLLAFGSSKRFLLLFLHSLLPSLLVSPHSVNYFSRHFPMPSLFRESRCSGSPRALGCPVRNRTPKPKPEREAKKKKKNK
jgi:hypothetical protein